MNLPDPSTPDLESRNLAAGTILELEKENRYIIYEYHPIALKHGTD
jgi:hypothetical protein